MYQSHLRSVFLSFFILISLSSFVLHKYYLSVSEVYYNKEVKAIQMVTRLFYDDLEAVLQERYDSTIVVDAAADQEKLDRYLEKYIDQKFIISINGIPQKITFLGKKYEDDFVVCFMEITEVSNINTLTIENTMLADLFPDQKNMIHTDIDSKKKTILLTLENPKEVLIISK